ncbi:hypothetical protein GTZ99_12570 [Novosphingobium sp. FSY-8]|uniref:Uncharacterized protein n=1 Tax=Novosphingobium ovatum TaxID=1908523 RepID=A0ABW9XFR9_9SPHN|nr:hypothetical protein [Novosphingobium ovatum]NBC37385.1 hypothetical protein [Novosphingobium ovatum]
MTDKHMRDGDLEQMLVEMTDELLAQAKFTGPDFAVAREVEMEDGTVLVYAVSIRGGGND